MNTTPVQNYLAQQATKWLSKKLNTKVVVQHVRIDFLNHINLQGLYIEDKAHDTLLYAGVASIKATDWIFSKGKPTLHYLELKNAYSHLYRTRASNEWNYDFIGNAFGTSSKPKTGTDTSKIELDLNKISLVNVRFHMDDNWGGEDIDIDIGDLQVKGKAVSGHKKLIDIDDISVVNTLVAMKEYKGGKPPRNPALDTIDRTPFNPDNWGVIINTLSLKGTGFNLTMDDKVPVADLFDENHLIIKEINTSIKNISIVGDTIRGETLHLYAHERCGIIIKDMHSKISVSPVACICDKLYMELNHSKIHDYYAMHYKHFPNFLSYIDSVVMVGHLNNSSIDTRDIAFFAPEMKALPAILQVSGDGKGTVANLSGKHLVVSDGNSVLKGNLTMKGLPNIYSTYITFTDAELFTNGAGVLKYAPGLKDNPDLDIAPISHAYFKGNYEGYVDNFGVKGVLTTNLGAVSADVKMAIPGFKSRLATYTGKIATDNAQLGIVLRRPLLGGITCNEDITGSSFDRDLAQINMDGTIKEISINNYAYHNVTTHGTLGKKQFNGKLLVDDPNLALTFDGDLDYNDLKNIKIAATAHLLYSNLKAMNITGDSVTTSADFDLNCTGSNIDNFLGYARLYNIDLKRNAHKVAVDSIYLNSGTNIKGQKELTIKSNVLTANIYGQYQLSKLPSSVQYYLSKYIPNYINAPVTFPSEQNLEFSITTRNIDSLLAVSFEEAKGFDSSTVSGSLNTNAQKLTLNVAVPYGSIGRFHMRNININGLGNQSQIALNASVDNVSIGDSMINSSLAITTTLAHDSLNFVVATTSPDSSSSIALNGQILARKDSLFLSILPSQFFLNRARWDIAGGSKVVYSSKYLDVENIVLSSALQRVTANTKITNNEQSLVINTENLDLSQAGYWFGISAYQPDGRLNGSISIDKIFKQLYVSANLKATDVKLGTDTVGTINLIGFYDGAMKQINLDPQTGIYRDNSFVTAAGYVSFDSTTNQKIDGTMSFKNAKVAWSSPFLIGIFSHLGGVVNGEIKITGKSYAPEINGLLNLNNGALRLDYMGCNYTIPSAQVKITNRRISWGTMQIFDSYHNVCYASGHFSHDLFSNMKMHIKLQSEKFEVMNLTANDNNLFYGKLIGGMDSFKITGPFNYIKLHAYNAYPAGKSHIYIPLPSSGDISTYSYVSFKSYGKSQDKPKHISPYKLELNIDANLNELADMTIVLDPSTGDEITAKGEGNVQLSIPASNDIRITGLCNINEGTYDLTLTKLYHRQFILNRGSTISFQGPFMETVMNMNATYSRKARLYDLLTPDEIKALDPTEVPDAKAPQTVNILMHMTGPLRNLAFTYDFDLPDKRSIGTYAYTKLYRINQDDRQKTDQVGSFLLINTFLPSDGLGNNAGSALGNNIGQYVSGQLSAGLTNLVTKMTGDKKLNVDVLYNTYNFNDQVQNSIYNRNTVKVGVSHPFLNDRLTVEVGSTSDWGRPVAANSTSTNFNVTGDFRIQYNLSDKRNIRLNAFRTSDYDVTLDKDITRSGVGISWRKSFDQFYELFKSNKYAAAQKKEELKKQQATDSMTKKPVDGK